MRIHSARSGLACVQFLQVGLHDLLGRAIAHQPTLVQPQGPVAQAHNGRGVVADEQQGTALLEGPQKAHALLCEKGISHRQCLVHNKNIRIHVRHDSKGQTHHHPAGVTFYRLIDEFANVGKGDDVIVSGVDFLVGQALDDQPEHFHFTLGQRRVALSRSKRHLCSKPAGHKKALD